MRWRFSIPVRDVDCAFKLMRGELARGLALHSDGAMVSTELVVAAAQQGWAIAELGVRHRPRVAGEATGAKAGVVLRAFAEQRAFHRRQRAEGPAEMPAPTPISAARSSRA
jgi:hypothetical protein